jgi:hypothetical protein
LIVAIRGVRLALLCGHLKVGYGPTRDARPASSCVRDIGQGSAEAV